MAECSRAAIFDGHRVAIAEVPRPDPGPGAIRVAVLGCTICGSDLHTVEGRRAVEVPTILGHEIVGRIDAFGPGAPRCDGEGRPLELGDRIVWALVARCRDCFYCRKGPPQKCTRAVKYGHEPIRPDRPLAGGLAEHCILAPGTDIAKLPAALPLAVACPASCATATAAAALEAAGPVAGRAVLVLGAGLLGLTACAMASAAGAAGILCVDVVEGRRERSRAFGASEACGPGGLADQLDAITSGRGADIVLEMSGAPPAFEAAMDAARIGGTIVPVGAVFPTEPSAISAERIVRRNLAIRGVHNYEARHLRGAVRFLERSGVRLPFESLVSRWFPLEEVGLAFDEARQSEHLRVGVRP